MLENWQIRKISKTGAYWWLAGVKLILVGVGWKMGIKSASGGVCFSSKSQEKAEKSIDWDWAGWQRRPTHGIKLNDT